MYNQAYVYKWTQISTGKWYIGSRTAKGCHPSDGYICSSKIKKEIQESEDDWVRDILAIGESAYIRELEAKLLNLLNAKQDPLSFNKHNGDGKFTTLGKTDSLATRIKKSNSHKGKRTGEQNSFYGKKHTLESIQKSTKFGPENGMFGRKGSINPSFGLKRSDETKHLMSVAMRGNNHWSKNPKFKWACAHCGKTGTVTSNYNRWHGDKCKLKGAAE